MNGSVTTLTYSAADSAGLTAVWTGTTTVNGHSYAGPVYIKLVAVIQSGASGWSAESFSSAPGDPAVVALINSGTFSVSLEYLASSSQNGTYVPFDNFYNSAGVPGGSGGAQVDTDGEFAGVLNAVSVATFLANQAGLDATGGFAIADTAAAIGGTALDTLNGDANITAITVSDNAAVAVSVKQLIGDAAAIGKLANADASPYQLAVSDTASNVEAGLGSIESDLSHIASVTLTDGTVSVSAGTFGLDEGALDKIAGGFAISDAASAIGGTALDALNGDANITAITVSDNAAVSVSVKQLTGDAAAIGKLANADASPYQLAVSDTASNVEDGLAAIESNLSKIASVTLTSASGPVSVAVGTFGLDQGALDKIVGGFVISDAAAAIGGTALDGLNGDANITAITVSDNAAVVVSVDQLTSDAAAIGKLANADASPYQLAVSDTVSDVEAGLGSIESDLSHIASVTLTDGTVSVSAGTFGLDQGALDKIVGGFAISDAASAIGGTALDALNGDANITAITVSDNEVIAISAGQLTSDGAAIGKLANADASPYQLAITDTASNVRAVLGAIESDLNNIASVTLTSGTVTVSAGTFGLGQGALDKIVGGFAFSDTAAEIGGGDLDVLNGDANITAITVSDNGFIYISAGQLTSDASALSKLANADASPYQLAISDTASNVQAGLGVIESDLSHIAGITLVTLKDGPVTGSVGTFGLDQGALDKIASGFAISDTAKAIGGTALDTLNGDANITAITVSDNAAVAVSVAQLTSDAAAIGKLANADASPYQLAVSDTVANVTSALAALTADASHIAAITATGGKVNVSTAAFAANKVALDKIAGGFDVSDTVANVTSALAALTADASRIGAITATGGKVSVSTAAFAANKAALDKIAGGFNVSDTVANVTSALAALTADAGHIAAITVTNGKVSVSTAAFAANKAALDKIAGGFGVSDTVAKITSALAALTADASHIAAITATGGKVSVSTAAFTADKAAVDKITGGFDVSDTVVNVTSALAALENDVTKIDTIGFTNSGTHVLSLTAAQSTADANLVAKITGGYVLDVANKNGTTTTTGHGNGLLINAVAGHDTITGGGNTETFVFGAKFGHAVVTDFYNHSSGTTHDTISLRASEFASMAALYRDATQVGTSVLVTASNGDSLTLQGMTLAALHAASADFKFV